MFRFFTYTENKAKVFREPLIKKTKLLILTGGSVTLSCDGKYSNNSGVAKPLAAANEDKPKHSSH